VRSACLLLVVAMTVACRKSESPPDGAVQPAASTSAVAPPLDPALLVRDNCTSCHSDDLIAQQRLTAAQWTKVVTKMHGWGSPLADQRELDAVAAWLAGKYGPTAGPHAMPLVGAAAVAAALSPQPDGPFSSTDVAGGKTLFAQLCTACHGPEAQGDKLGVNLVDRPLLFRAADVARTVRTGRGKMPPFPALTDPQIGAILSYLRTLRPAL